jgi:hypothetical protein
MARRKPLPAAYRPSVRNVLRAYAAASEDEILAGKLWYSEAHDVARELGGPHIGAGILAALSPQCDWDTNVIMGREISAGRTPRYATGTNVAKARACDRGAPWRDVLGGPKVRAFATLIQDPDDSHAVVIDRHAFDAALGRITSDRDRALLLGRRGTYERFARVYRAAARVLGLTPATVQATVWVAWRRAKGLA